MSATFPTGVKSFTTKLAGDTVQASHANDLQDEVTAIETALVGGTLPAANGSALTALNASALASGTVAEARLASGTGTVNKVLRGNSTWGDSPGITTDGASAVQQIAFAAAQSASAGVNVLDDYEEGTFTPALKFGGASVGLTTSTSEGAYVKVGQLVYVTLRIVLTAKGSSTGAATITGLPFTAAAYFSGLSANFYDALGASVASLAPYIGNSGTTTVTLSYVPAAGASSLSAMTDATFTGSTTLILSGCYRASA